jgi:hypothetical protein
MPSACKLVLSSSWQLSLQVCDLDFTKWQFGFTDFISDCRSSGALLCSQDEEEHEAPAADSAAEPAKKKRKAKAYKKAPGAPIRGRSAYVLFSIAKREEVKKSLPEGFKVRLIQLQTSSNC